ncbi:hypothetical protein JHS3_04910 [Jeongeupia sp. HS-3]|nr:hypothetical protein JHS3_04910 [Jeongeupia sp. HS-3]
MLSRPKRWLACALLAAFVVGAVLLSQSHARHADAVAVPASAVQQLKLDVQAHRPQSEQQLQRLAQDGNPLAARTLAELAGEAATPQALQQSLSWYRQGAAHGDGESAYQLGMAYLQGRSVPVDVAGARRWFERAGDLPAAQFRLATMLLRGEGGAANLPAGQQLLVKAAASGDANAMFMLGNRYRAGEGVAHDDAQALHWYQLAANQEHAAALQTLSLAYAHGELGLAVDPHQAQFLGEYAGHAAKCHMPHSRVALF